MTTLDVGEALAIPDGELLRSRVVSDPGQVLEDALDLSLTGYAVLEPQETLLLDGDERGVLTFSDGVPVLAYHTGTDRGGSRALADLAVPGPYRVELVSLPTATVAELHETPELRVPPAMPAERLAGDPVLATRTRERAPADRPTDTDTETTATDDGMDAVAAFLEDEEKIEAIREQAREEARERAEEWDLGEFGGE
jgi:hypothetical protein